jgi:hypothetical protein
MAFLREIWAADGATSMVILMSAAKDLYLFSLCTLRSARCARCVSFFGRTLLAIRRGER